MVQERRKPEKYNPPNFRSNFALFIIDSDPRTITEEMDLEDGKIWQKAMVEEMKALDNNEAWDIVELSTGRNPIGSKWLNAKGKVEKYTAQLVAKGYSQVEGIDFDDICTPAAKLN